MPDATENLIADTVAQLTRRSVAYGIDSPRGELAVERVLERAECLILFVQCRPRLELVAKVPRPNSRVPAVDRPRCFPLLPPRVRSEYEHRAMRAIDRDLRQLNDPRFGSIPVVDYLEESGTLVMQRVSQPTLRKRLWRSSRFCSLRTPGSWFRAVHSCGAWLRRFHELEEISSDQRFVQPAEFLTMIEQLSGYLANHLGRREYFTDLVRRMQEAVPQEITGPLPLGHVHGDYAPRNIFVDREDRITVCDALGRWQAPIYQDLAEFLANLKACGFQAASLRTALSSSMLNQSEAALLSGYFGDEPIPWSVLRLFEIHALLAKWAAAASRQGRFRRISLWLHGRVYQRLIETNLDSLSRPSSVANPGVEWSTT